MKLTFGVIYQAAPTSEAMEIFPSGFFFKMLFGDQVFDFSDQFEIEFSVFHIPAARYAQFLAQIISTARNILPAKKDPLNALNVRAFYRHLVIPGGPVCA